MNEEKDTNILEVTDLTYTYPDKTNAINNLSFSVKSGEVVGLIGPNGAGKSTLFLLLMGFLEAQQGKIHIFNQELNKKTKKSIRKKLGFVFQNPNDQLFSPTLWEDVAFGPYNLGYNREEISRRVDQTLDIVKLLQYKNKAPHYLSFGEKKRASLATILSMDPQILLLDEPFTNLDPQSYEEILNLILKFKSENLTIIIATHDVDILPLLVERCILIDKGYKIHDGPVQEILTNYDLLMNHKMRMPILGQLFYNLKAQNIIHGNNLPLTISEAESFLIDLLKNEQAHSNQG